MAVSEPEDNESVVWRYLIQRFTREQTAGIMGNLMQEHRFNTSDVAGGLGIAQWIGARRSNLITKGDYTNLQVQLDYLMEELEGSEHQAGNAIRQSSTIEEAVLAFQNKFERCGLCREDQRIEYAYSINARH